MTGSGGKRYQMRQNMVTIGHDFCIENDQGQKVFKVDGKALRVRQTLVFEDAHGSELAKIQERKLRVKDTLEIALEKTGLQQVKVQHRPRLLSDNGPCYISHALRDYLQQNQIEHVRVLHITP